MGHRCELRATSFGLIHFLFPFNPAHLLHNYQLKLSESRIKNKKLKFHSCLWGKSMLIVED